MWFTHHYLRNQQAIINKNLKPNIPNPKINLLIPLRHQANLPILHQHKQSFSSISNKCTHNHL